MSLVFSGLHIWIPETQNLILKAARHAGPITLLLIMDNTIQERFPLVDANLIKEDMTGAHWRWNSKWLATAGILYQFMEAHPLPPETWPFDLWLFIQGLFHVFPEPMCLSLDLDMNPPTSTPIWYLLPHMTALTALELKWDENGSSTDSTDTLSRWLDMLTPSQCTQLHYLTLNLSGCNATPEEVSHWLEKMPHLHSLTIRDSRNLEDLNPIAIPPLAELQQLHLDLAAPCTIPVLPALNRLFLSSVDAKTPSSWIPNLAGMTSLESLRWEYLRYTSDVLDMVRFLPPQLANLTFWFHHGDDASLQDDQQDAMWNGLMQLTQLVYLYTPAKYPCPERFVRWMKQSQIAHLSTTMYTADKQVLKEVLPAMPSLRSIHIYRDIDMQTFGLKPTAWMAPIIQTCPQLTRLDIQPNSGDYSTFVEALTGLTNLVHLRIDAPEEIPTSLFSLHFTHLTDLNMTMIISDQMLPDLADFLGRHPNLTQLGLTFSCHEGFGQSVAALATCTALTSLHRTDQQLPDHQIHFYEPLPPSLRRLTWTCPALPDDSLTLPPAEHTLTHFQNETFDNNIRLHQTLVDLHTDWLQRFWPTVEVQYHP